MKKLIALLSVTALCGCAIAEPAVSMYKYRWIPPENHPAVVIINHETPKDVSRVCEMLGAKTPGYNSVILACAIVVKNTCIIHLPKDPPDAYLTHELLHCSGWKHEIIGK